MSFICRPLLVNRDCKQLKLEMKGIEYMNDDPAEVDVLYGKIESKPDANLLQYLTNIIVEYFTQHKLIKASERQDVKLHVTLMNTLFREEEPEEINQEIAGLKRTKTIRKQRSTFNAVNILQVSLFIKFCENKFNTPQFISNYLITEISKLLLWTARSEDN